MKKMFIFWVCILFLQACATATMEKLNTKNSVSISNGMDQKIYISLPKDGIFQNIKYEFSGQQVQQTFFDSLSRYSDELVLGTQFQNLEDAKNAAKEVQAQILVYPVITHWEDRNTPWSGLRDKVRINVLVCDVKQNLVIDKTNLYATNRWLTFVNAAPSNLLRKIIPPYITQLYE